MRIVAVKAYMATDDHDARREVPRLPTIVRDLQRLIELRATFPTIYADPPWPYANHAARAAAEKHYRTMTLEGIVNAPVKKLAAKSAHLHLWTTNSFLREAFQVIDAWGFRYKSCLVWIKPQLGTGNYWRVCHEFLLFGVRGGLPFRKHTVRSWQKARRTAHSRKPYLFRELVEQVSPGPYLELYGREELPNSGWTVFGDQVERRLF
jgi:N6-adenosine-specific RNA methylase IME4